MISVVIPTRDRCEVLAHTMALLGRQRIAGAEFEVIVVDNGSKDETSALVRDCVERLAVPVKLLDEPKAGPAVARNRGATAAKGEVILFLGDDTAPADDGLIAAHAARHARRPEDLYAVLGHVAWSPDAPVTPFMLWLETGGPQFGFGKLVPGPVSPAKHFYTSHVSLKLRALEAAGWFDERFPYAAVEDNELGVRLEERGLELEYDPTLVVHHDHPTTLSQSLERLVRVGRSAALYNRLHPEHPLRGLPVPKYRFVLRLLEPIARLVGREAAPRRFREPAWQLLHIAAYSRGYALGPPETGG
jgi:glycosyltransferase involved in cell wall biosynthesis